jgi:hypothetical protein
MTGNQQDMSFQALSDMANRSARVVIADPLEFDQLHLRVTDAVMQQIRSLEESILTAEERLGTFRVG